MEQAPWKGGSFQKLVVNSSKQANQLGWYGTPDPKDLPFFVKLRDADVVFLGCHFHGIYNVLWSPEKRGRKPGMSLNGDRIVESMGRIVAEEPAWWGCAGCRAEDVERGKECVGRGTGKEEGVAGRRGCLLPHKPTQARPNPNYHHGFAASYHRRSSMATTFQCHYILDQSHRCSGPLQQLLHDLVSDRGVSNECWILLQQRLLTAADPRLADPHFAPALSPGCCCRNGSPPPPVCCCWSLHLRQSSTGPNIWTRTRSWCSPHTVRNGQLARYPRSLPRRWTLPGNKSLLWSAAALSWSKTSCCPRTNRF